MPPVRVRLKKPKRPAGAAAAASEISDEENRGATSDEGDEEKRRPESTLTDRQKGELRACFDAFDEDGSGNLCVRRPTLSPRTALRAVAWPRRILTNPCVRSHSDTKEVAKALRMLGLCTSEDEVCSTRPLLPCNASCRLLRASPTRVPALCAHQIQQAIREVDEGGDGIIQWEEFLAFMAKHMQDPKHMNAEVDMGFEGACDAAGRPRNGRSGNLDGRRRCHLAARARSLHAAAAADASPHAAPDASPHPFAQCSLTCAPRSAWRS